MDLLKRCRSVKSLTIAISLVILASLIALVVFAIWWDWSPGDPAVTRATKLLMGTIRILPDDGRIVAVSESGDITQWDENSSPSAPVRRLDLQAPFIEAPLQIEPCQGDNTLLMIGRTATPGEPNSGRNLVVLSEHDLSLVKTFSFPCHAVFCVPTPGLIVATGASTLKYACAPGLHAWKLGDNNLMRLEPFLLSPQEGWISSVVSAAPDAVLAHFHIPDQYGSKEAGHTELRLVAVPSWRTLRRVKLPPRRKGSWWRLKMASGGRYAVLFAPGVIEVYEIPTLKRVGMLVLAKEAPTPEHVAISSDGKHVAFGLIRLATWEVGSETFRVLDHLNWPKVSAGLKTIDPEFERVAHDVLTKVYVEYQYTIADMQFGTKPQELLAVTRDGVFYRWDVVQGKQVSRKRIAKVKYFAIPKSGAAEEHTQNW